jgi:hypothetical protein
MGEGKLPYDIHVSYFLLLDQYFIFCTPTHVCQNLKVMRPSFFLQCPPPREGVMYASKSAPKNAPEKSRNTSLF